MTKLSKQARPQGILPSGAEVVVEPTESSSQAAAQVMPPRARLERDFLGEKAIPAGAYWGVHTARALENFTASGTPVSVHPTLVAGLGSVKLAAVRANQELGLIGPRRASAIERACQDVREGLLDDQFVVDVLQGGAGTSTNMNANEVIANRALELLGLPAGSYDEVHPLDHVNRSQSTRSGPENHGTKGPLRSQPSKKLKPDGTVVAHVRVGKRSRGSRGRISDLKLAPNTHEPVTLCPQCALTRVETVDH